MSGSELTLGARAAVRSRRSPSALPADAPVVSLLTLDLVLVVVTQKVAIPLAGREAQIALAFLIHAAVLAVLAVRGRLFASGPRLVLFAVLTGVVAFAQIRLDARSVSVPSMLLMLMTTAMLVFVVPLSWEGYRCLLGRFVLIGCGAAALVGLDWAVQLAGWPMPDLEALIPHPLVYYEYNYIQPVHWGSPWMKPNGLFFLETSHVSQFIGMALVVELAMFRRWLVTGLLAAALAGTLGVTGMLLVGTSLPFLLARARPAVLVAGLLLVSLAVTGGSRIGALEGLFSRTAEFSQDSSSGYNRFVLPFEWSIAALNAPADEAWLGTGAGTMPKAINDDEAGIAGYAWPPFTKVGVEYGTIALLVWAVFLCTSLFGGGIPAMVAWAAFVQYSFLNGSLNVPIHTVYCVLLSAGYLITGRRSQPSARALSRPPSPIRKLQVD